jgi:hypothetical protein
MKMKVLKLLHQHSPVPTPNVNWLHQDEVSLQKAFIQIIMTEGSGQYYKTFYGRNYVAIGVNQSKS